MAIRNIQPFYGGAADGSFPLSMSPYLSRVEEQEIVFDGAINGDGPKNYQFVNFRPGFALQASELNEMQEHYQMQMTLTITMMHNWLMSGPGYVWDGYDENSSGSEGGDGSDTVNSSTVRTGLGVGGYLSADGGASHNPEFAISGPGWRGSCPLYPYSNPYQGSNSGPDGKLVSWSYLNTTDTIRIVFWSGWWLTELRAFWNGSDSPEDGLSGMKHWVYLDADTDSSPSPTYTVDIPVGGGDNKDIVAGLLLSSDYISCCPDDQGTPELPCDSSLGDNANGNSNTASCGASRYTVNVIGASSATPDDPTATEPKGYWGNQPGEPAEQRDNLSAVIKVNPAQRTIRYMNNMLIGTW
tara:strand:- start:227 stop:1291 length:1065 start_codon:yes stop_codon:yes gene_type:complete